MSATNKTAYRKHTYSGPQKSLKKVRAGLKQFHKITSRGILWRRNHKEDTPLDGRIDQDESKSQYAAHKILDEQKRSYTSLKSIITMLTADTAEPPLKPNIKTYERKKPTTSLESTINKPSMSTAEPLLTSRIITHEPNRPKTCLKSTITTLSANTAELLPLAHIIKHEPNRTTTSLESTINKPSMSTAEPLLTSRIITHEPNRPKSCLKSTITTLSANTAELLPLSHIIKHEPNRTTTSLESTINKPSMSTAEPLLTSRIITHDPSRPKTCLKSTITTHSANTAETRPKPNIKTYERKRPRIRFEPEISVNMPFSSTVDPIQIRPQSEPKTEKSVISGYHIVDLKHVMEWAFQLERHKNVCQSSQIEFVSEDRNGFHSDITFKCSMCDKIWKNSTEKDNKINTSFVWATLTSGSSYEQASHITSLMDIPTMSSRKFSSIEKELGSVWHSHLTEEINNAGEKEKCIALEKGYVAPDGVPYISVYVDGGWLKRSHGNNFDSSSGMACIIGQETKKCLYLGIRNKYCYTCQYYKKKNMNSKDHHCPLNFTGPSTAMESKMIVEGFQKSKELHGLRYLTFIGDGDSSIYATVKEKVAYGQQIQRIECTNNVVKDYTDALYKMSEAQPVNKCSVSKDDAVSKRHEDSSIEHVVKTEQVYSEPDHIECNADGDIDMKVKDEQTDNRDPLGISPNDISSLASVMDVHTNIETRKNIISQHYNDEPEIYHELEINGVKQEVGASDPLQLVGVHEISNDLSTKIKIEGIDESNADISVTDNVYPTEASNTNIHPKNDVFKLENKVKSKKKTVTKTKLKQAKTYICNECNFKFMYRCNIISHIKLHMGEKPFSCNYCQYRCANKSYLTIHIRTHTGEKPFPCKFCDYRSKGKSALERHLRTHTGEKPYKCKYCEYRCKVKSSLTAHIRKHTGGDKPYACEFWCVSGCSEPCLVSHKLCTK